MQKYLLNAVLFIAISFSINIISGQEKKIEKAKTQYDRYQYIDAQKTYLKIIEKGYKDADLLKNLANSYYEYMNKFTELAEDDKRTGFYKERPNYLERIDFQSGRYEIENSSINSSYTDFGAAFYGEFVVFSSSRDTLILRKQVHQWNNESFLDLYKSEYNPVNGELSEVEKMSRVINTDFHESTPVFTDDGKTMYFTRNNYAKGKFGKDKTGTNKLKIYRSTKNKTGKWTTPQSLAFNSDEYSTAHPTLSPDEKVLYFSSDMPGGQGQSDIYRVDINPDGSFGEPKNLGTRINTEGKETFPFMSNNDDLYFSSNGHYGLGGLDVFVTKPDPVSEEDALVVNIGKPVNSPEDDFAFIVDDTIKRGYFSSNRKEGGIGGDDIYSFLQLEDIKPFCKITVNGLITDKDTGEPLPGTNVSLLNTDNELVQSVVAGEDGSYTFEDVKCTSKYFVRAEKEEYNTEENLISAPDKTQEVEASLALQKKIKTAEIGDDLGKILSLKPIYFDFDQSYIREDASIELAKVIEAMNQYPEMKIDVRSHTDSHGDDAYNLDLSDRRAKSTVKYMIKKGVAADRLTGKGYGETQPVNDCGNGSNCNKNQYQLNRRSEFIIVK